MMNTNTSNNNDGVITTTTSSTTSTNADNSASNNQYVAPTIPETTSAPSPKEEEEENNVVIPSRHELMMENKRLQQDLEEYKMKVMMLQNQQQQISPSSSTMGTVMGKNRKITPFQISSGGGNDDNDIEKENGYHHMLEDDEDGIEHNDIQEDFIKSLTDRASWLVGLLVLQSMSSFIIAQNEDLLKNHAVIIQFLTMLVGAGGNAGNQSSVRVIRGLAIGSINSTTTKPFLKRELINGLCLSFILGFAGFSRAVLFLTPWPETFAITTCLFIIVASSVIIGAVLPLGMKTIGIDPAHSSTTIQVVMDILGVLLTCRISSWILDSLLSEWD